MLWRLLTLVLLILMLPGMNVASAQAAEPRAPVPSKAAIAEATTLIAELYKKDSEAAKTPLSQQVLAKRLLDEAIKSQDEPAARYALFEIARQLAIKIGDLELALKACEEQGRAFDFDVSSAKLGVFTEIAQVAKSSPARYALARYLTLQYTEAMQAESFEVAQELADLGLATSKRTNDPDFIKQWTRRREQLTAQRKESEPAMAALKTLLKNAADADANLAAGRYLCCWKRDWERGLPMLALASDQDWQKVAERELRMANADRTEQIALADAWYDLAQKQPGQVKAALLLHAGKLYRAGVESLAALPKRRVENRIHEIDAAANPLPLNEWVELLDGIEVSPRHVAGKWERQGLNFVSNSDDVARIKLPVVIDGPYEMEIRATRYSGPDQFHLSMSRVANQAKILLNCLAGQVSGIDTVDGKGCPDNSTRKDPIDLPNGQPYLATLQVDSRDDQRAIGLRVNNRPYVGWKGLANSLGGSSEDQGMVLTTWKTHFVLHSIRVRVKSGEAWYLEP